MLGVRDMILSARRLGASRSNMSLSEMDMDDMFWQIPQNEVLASVDWLFSVLDGSFSKQA